MMSNNSSPAKSSTALSKKEDDAQKTDNEEGLFDIK